MSSPIDPVLTPEQLADSQHTLPGLVELVYVRVGNEIMADALGKLENALTATQSGLDVMTTLQGLHNEISIQSLPPLPFDFTKSDYTFTYTTMTGSPPTAIVELKSIAVNDADGYIAAYNKAASAYYGKAIAPTFTVTIPGGEKLAILSTTWPVTAAEQPFYDYFKDQLFDTKARIQEVIDTLTPITDPLDPTTLLAKLKTVINDMPTDTGDPAALFQSIRTWILDGYSEAGVNANSGNIQQHITSALTAGEALNATQNASVRNYMFLFQQYYQSAAAILTQLNQILQGSARKISG